MGILKQSLQCAVVGKNWPNSYGGVKSEHNTLGWYNLGNQVV